MTPAHPNESAREGARLLLMVMAAAIERADQTDGAMRIYLDPMNRYAVKLLTELGGFEDILQHPDSTPCAPRVGRTSGEMKLRLLVLQEALKYADQNDPPTLERVDDLYSFAMTTLRELGFARTCPVRPSS